MTNTPELGRLERVDPRTAWESESGDFTPGWRRRRTSPFSRRRCRDTSSPDGESWVLIENQLERTDHKHLGQLLTYAAGLHTVMIIWVAQSFTDEHQAALDWLNEITDERFRFFGLEVELWRIGNSLAAPKFNIVAKPNEWVRETAKRTSGVNKSERNAIQERFWGTFQEYLASQGSQLKTKTRRPRYYADYPIGRHDLHIGASLNNDGIRSFVYFLPPNAKAHLRLLHRDREAIEEELGTSLRWRAGRVNASIRVEHPLQAN